MLHPLVKDLTAIILYYSGLIKMLRHLGQNYAKILLFHSINDNDSPFIKGTNASVSRDTFENYLKYISKNYQIISLQSLVHSLHQRRIPRRSVVLTFDDGFADNFHIAYPFLKRYRIPATIFLSTDCIQNKKPIWIQELYYLINKVGVQPIINTLYTLSQNVEIPPYIARIPLNKNSQKNIEEYMAYAITKNARDQILLTLYRHFNIQRKKVFSKRKLYLTWAQIQQMNKDAIVFGNHAASHTPLSTMSSVEQEDEIVRSKKLLEKHLDINFVPFSYPYGGRKDFTPVTKEIARTSGHSCILTAMPTLNDENTSPYDLGRINIDDVPVHRFAFELEKGVLNRLIGRKKATYTRSQ
jgi:peptidoglycan/xylan/chitin deacetylase (PgdA/CDA1 family)